jgi:putative ABC transport system permease protein
MLRNYLKIALRNILKNKAFSIINISGLAVGMACCVLILLFVTDELTYDSYHEQAGNIFRMVATSRSSGEERDFVPLGAPYAEFFKNALPEVKNAVRFYPHGRMLVEYADRKFFEERFFFGDPSAFDVFSFPFLKGNPSTALKAPYTVVLTETAARKYFGRDDPTGKSLRIDNEHIFQIDGVIQDLPPNSHFHFDFLASLETLSDLYGPRFLTHPGYLSFYSYLLCEDDTDPKAMEEKMHQVTVQNYGKQVASYRTIWLQPLKSIHLHSRLEGELEANGSMSFIYLYSAIALFILLIAAFNFVNLSTARSTKRAREVGMRKVLGAARSQLVEQFVGESVVFSVLSLLLGLLLVGFSLPFFNSLTGKEMSVNSLANPSLMLGLVGIVVAAGILGGLYPAVFLSSFEPIRTLKGKLGLGGKSGAFRRLLVVAQFAISISLIIGTFVIRDQLSYMRNQNLGFDKEQVVVIPMHDQNARQSYQTIKEGFLKNPSVIHVTASSSVPGRPVTKIAYRVEGLGEREHTSIDTIFVDYDFLDTLDIPLVEGRNFSKAFSTDQESAFIVNETAVRELNWSDALNKQVIWPSDLRRLDAIVKKGYVVGVAKDFHLASLHENIAPVIFQIQSSNFRFISARIAPENIPATIAFFRDKWRQFSPAFPFEYSFLDEDFDALYRADEKIGRVIGVFSLLAIIVACLGLFGLASYSAEQRTKEIGIRKVMGASVSGIIWLLSRQFTRWVLVANIIAWPVAYYAMNRWLQNFAYKMSLGIGIFAQASLLAFFIALATVSYQSVKVALSDPVNSLRYE